MVQRYVRCPNHPGNRVAEIIDGVGLRGSSISDADHLTVIHDGGTRRFLFQEMKWESEPIDGSRRWILKDLARLDGVTSLLTRLLDSGLIEVTVYPNKPPRRMTEADYRNAIKKWWGAS